MEKIKALLNDKARMREVILYLVFGVLTTLVNLAVYGGLVMAVPSSQALLGTGAKGSVSVYWYQAASVIAWIAAVSFAYVTNKIFVFQSRHLHGPALLKEAASFFGARVVSLVLFDLAGLTLCVQAFGMNDFVAKLLMNVLVIIFNYVASKLVIFRKKES